jgi:hypothetical protein
VVNAEILKKLAQRACHAVDVPMVCCCVVDRGWPAFVFHAESLQDRRSTLARLVTEMVLQVVRPIGVGGRVVTSRTALFVAGRCFVYPIAIHGSIQAAIGVATWTSRSWSSEDLARIDSIGMHLVDLARSPSSVRRRDRRERAERIEAAFPGTSRRPSRLKTSW